MYGHRLYYIRLNYIEDEDDELDVVSEPVVVASPWWNIEQAESAAMATRVAARIKDLRMRGELHCWIVFACMVNTGTMSRML